LSNAVLFFRTEVTRSTSIASLPSAQKIEFDTKDNIAQSIIRDLHINIVKKSSPTNDGTRIIKVQDNGIRSLDFPVPGHIKISDDDNLKKLINFPLQRQVTDDFPFGIFGIFWPNAVRLGFDNAIATTPATTGLCIESLPLEHRPTAKMIKFTINLTFGGTLVAQP